MKLTVIIRKATDGRMELQVEEMPQLEVSVKRVGEIPEVVRDAAAGLTGRPKCDFEVIVGY